MTSFTRTVYHALAVLAIAFALMLQAAAVGPSAGGWALGISALLFLQHAVWLLSGADPTPKVPAPRISSGEARRA